MDWQVINVPLVAGLNQKVDERALPPPGLLRALDVQSDEPGGLQTRYPYGAAFGSILGGGTLSNCRRIYALGDELVCFTKDTLYSWNAAISKWVSRGQHLAVATRETTQFATTDDERDCDRAELNGTVVYAWVGASGTVYCAALDKTTGSVLMAPTTVTADSRPHLVALTTKIMLFVATGDPALNVYALDPADPAAALAGGATNLLVPPDFNLYYDAVKQPGADAAIWACRRTTTTSYTVGKVTAGLTVTSSNKARTCDGPIAVSCEPTGTQVQIIRANGTNIQGDLITIASFVDTAFVAKAVGTVAGTAVDQIAACHRSVQDSSQYRCYAFWHSQESAASSTVFATKMNYVDTGGNLGTQATVGLEHAVASRAFEYDGHVYCWITFASQSTFTGAGDSRFTAQLNNVYFLLRDDASYGAFVCAAVPGRSGGFPASIGLLPGVVLTSGSTTYSWCGVERRKIPLGGENHDGYAARAPIDITFTFDSNEARRVASIGSTAYISGGTILQYDGVQLTECGFLTPPWSYSVAIVGGTPPGAGTYTWKMTWRWDNAKGDRDRSSVVTTVTFTLGAAEVPRFSAEYLQMTRKSSPAVAGEVWRTPANPTSDSLFYLVTSQDPANATNPNRYLPNSSAGTGAFPVLDDSFTDAVLTTKETNPENGGVLENLAPPGASVIASTDVRIFLGNVAGDPDRIWYSKTHNPGEVAAFNDLNVFAVPRRGGAVTAIRFLNETVIVFRETACYAFSGDGFSNDGTGSNFGPATSANLDIARELSLDVGAVSDDACCQYPGGILFKSNKGWYNLTRDGNVQYVGGKVSDYDSETVLSVDVMETQHHIRVLTASRMLVFDYLLGEWFEWSISDGVHSCVWNGAHVYLTATGPKQQATTYSGINYGMDVETAWIKLNDLQCFGALKKIALLGQQGDSDIGIRVRIYRNYKPTAIYDRVYQQIDSVITEPLQIKAGRYMECEAIKVRITVTGALGDGAVAAGMFTSVGGNWNSGGTVATNSTVWNALLQARNTGTDGNSLTFSVYTTQGPAGCELRDGQRYDGSNWLDQENNVGVRAGDGSTIAQLEAAIAGSRLIQVTAGAGDAAPTKVISDTNTAHASNVFSSGATAAPTGTPPKLTGIALEVGLKVGIFKRLPVGQRI